MPTYNWRCDCGNYIEIYSSLDDYKPERTCDHCNQPMYQLYSFNVGDKMYLNPLHSDSLAINPNQIDEHRQAFPDVPIDNEGRPVLTSFKQHENYIKKRGFVKPTQRLKPKGKKL